MKQRTDSYAGTVAARCTKVPAHRVEVTAIAEPLSGGMNLTVRCECCASMGFVNADDVRRLTEKRNPIAYDQFILTME